VSGSAEHEDVGAGAALGAIAAGEPVQPIVSAAALQAVEGRIAGDDVVAGAADRILDPCAIGDLDVGGLAAAVGG